MPGIDYGDTLMGPVKEGMMQLVHVEGTVAGGAGVITADASACSPGATITGGAGGLATVSFPTGNKNVYLCGPPTVQLADSVGAIGTVRTESALTGTITLEFWVSNTAGTAAILADGSRVHFTFFVGSD
jgi:hypothetical protein